MALISCPECKGKVADSAISCPHCGYVINGNRVVSRTTKPTPTQVGLSTKSLSCVHCGAPLSASDIMSSGWAHCNNCGADVHLEGNNTTFSDGIVEKVFPFATSKDDFHRICMERLMEVGAEDIFSKITNIQVTQHYVWVRAFGVGNDQEFYPMDSFGEQMFKRFNDGNAIMSYEMFDSLFPRESMVSFCSDVVRGKALHAKEMSSSECRYNYMSDPNTNGMNPTDFYYCLPFFEECYEYNNNVYHFYGDGGEAHKFLLWDSIAENSHITQDGPRYTTAYPLMYTFIALAIIAAVIFVITVVISIFASNGFWLGIVYLVLIGIVLSIVGGIIAAIIGVAGAAIAAIFALIDLPIQKSINAKRRKKYRTEYERIQQRKQEEARTNIGLELDYTVPEYPIP